jgi:TIR domain
MPGLSESEIKKIVERYIGVSQGYLGDFTHSTHASFYPEYCGLEINPDDYQRPQDEQRTTIRKRFIAILENSCPQTQAKIIRGVLQRFSLNSLDKTPITRTKELYEELMTIAQRLENAPEYIAVEPDTIIPQEIFISYTWGGQGEDLAKLLDETFQARGVAIIRDKKNLGYKGNIKEFMERLGRGKCIIAVICDKYLKSDSCMFELVQIAMNGNFWDRVFPIVLDDAQINKPVERIKYIQHWENQIRELDTEMKTVSAANMQGFRDDIDLYAKIRGTIAELTNILKNMNTLTVEMHNNSNFDELFTSINNKLSE